MSRGALITLVLVALMGTGLAINIAHEVQNPKGFLDFPIEEIGPVGPGDFISALRVVSAGWGEDGNETHVFLFEDDGLKLSTIAELVGDDYSKSVYPIYLRYFPKGNRYQIVDRLRIVAQLKPPISQTRVEVPVPSRSWVGG